MTSLLSDEDNPPTALPFPGGPVRTTGFNGDPSKTTTCCAMCRMPRNVNADRLCRECDQREAEAEACREDMTRWDRNEQLFGEARALKGRIGQLLEDEYRSNGRSPARVTALRAAEIAMAEVVAQLHRSGGV